MRKTFETSPGANQDSGSNTIAERTGMSRRAFSRMLGLPMLAAPSMMLAGCLGGGSNDDEAPVTPPVAGAPALARGAFVALSLIHI